MKDSLILEGKIYISARRAAKLVNYAQDYIGQLCRNGKLDCKMVGRSWFVTEESLLSHRELSIDATQERVSRISRKQKIIEDQITQVLKEEVKEIPSSVAITDTRTVETPVYKSDFKYEAEKGPLLPEVKKKVPSQFSLPKISNIKTPFTQSPFWHFDKSRSLSQNLTNPMTAMIIALVILFGGFAITSGTQYLKHSISKDSSQASIISVAGDFVHRFFSFFGNMGSNLFAYLHEKSPSSDSVSDVGYSRQSGSQSYGEIGTTTEAMNGIGIVPSTGSSNMDEKEKSKIRNSFSDEVTIKPDESGTAGVITPVFKKTDGKGFVYVLVPVKDGSNKVESVPLPGNEIGSPSAKGN